CARWRANSAGCCSYHSRSTVSRLHRYLNELDVPQRRLVGLLRAHPILCDFSPALLGGAKIWSMAILPRRVCVRIFRSLSDARCLFATWLLDPRRLCDLSPP